MDVRIRAAKKFLDDAEDLKNKHPAFDFCDAALETIRLRNGFDHWLELVETRQHAKRQLAALEGTVIPGDLVPWGVSKDSIPFAHARLLAMNAYIATSWSLIDGITGFVGRIFCAPSQGFNASEGVKLKTFTDRETMRKSTAGILFNFVPEFYGWAASLSFFLRNIFIHEGGRLKGKDVFKGKSAASLFEVSDELWDEIESGIRAANPDIDKEPKSPTWITIAKPVNDIRIVLDACERETDEALGVLLGAACHSYGGFIAYAVGSD